jgi:hypothetical protein
LLAVARFSKSAFKDPSGMGILFSCGRAIILSFPQFYVGGFSESKLWYDELSIMIDSSSKFGTTWVSTKYSKFSPFIASWQTKIKFAPETHLVHIQYRS